MQLMSFANICDDWEEKANKVLSHFNYQHPDEIDLYDICWRYGIIIKPLEHNFLDQDICYESIRHLKAYSVPSMKARRGTIYLDPSLDAIEKKLLLTEEFCHIYSHYSSQLDLEEYIINKQENQAKKMVAYMLSHPNF